MPCAGSAVVARWLGRLGSATQRWSHGLLLPFPARARSFLQDSRAGSTRRTVAPSPVEFGSLDAGWR